MLTPLQQLWAALAGILGGLLSGFFGIGGNVVLVPLLALALGMSQQQAQGITLAALLPPLGLPAVWQYKRSGVPILWRVVGVAIAAFLGAVALGSALANRLPAATLRMAFAVLLIITAFRTWRTKDADAHRAFFSTAPPGYLGPSVLAGLGGGLASGLLGIGGGIVIIPLLMRGLGLSQRQAALTSLVMLLPPIALPGVWVYAQSQPLPWGALLPVAGGFLIGSFLGARVSRQLSANRLASAFALLLVLTACALIVSALKQVP